jgi:hypothetical protein
MSWTLEVIADNRGKRAGKALRFATKKEAEAVRNLMLRSMRVRDIRVVKSDKPVSYAWVEGESSLVEVK